MGCCQLLKDGNPAKSGDPDHAFVRNPPVYMDRKAQQAKHLRWISFIGGKDNSGQCVSELNAPMRMGIDPESGHFTEKD